MIFLVIIQYICIHTIDMYVRTSVVTSIKADKEASKNSVKRARGLKVNMKYQVSMYMHVTCHITD